MRKTTVNRRFALTLAAGTLAAGIGVVHATSAMAADNNLTAWNFFRGKGFTAAQTAGLIGNFIVESGADPINPAAKQYGGGPGRGIAQWEGSRLTALYNYATQRGLPWYNLQLQLDFVWKELMGPESYAYSKIKATTTVSGAAVAVRQYYERPSVHNDTARINAANSVYSRYSGSTPPPSTETSFPTLKQGSTGSAVTTLQYLLRSKGYTITVDGSFGSATHNVVVAFQRSRGLVADGVAGPITWNALVPTLKQGSTGSAVTALQVELKAHGKYTGAIDGSFGPATYSAVVSYQKSVGLVADGVAGPKTWGSLVD
ncbi:phage tail tip lysozyme [Propionibacteriaceae bacterium G1746]|uniref:phage tail tip lysozyme n=1 Tax=Aestuariimicrobium sp. G57 TaxID=3418485 RepID=UPI003C21C7DA